MSGGAPAAPAPTPPVFTDPVSGRSFMTGAELNDEIDKRSAQEQAQSDVNKGIAAQIQGNNENMFQWDLNNGLNDATTDVNRYFTNNGYDPTPYSGDIAAAIRRAGSSIVDPAVGATTENVPSYKSTVTNSLSPNLGAQILQQINSGVQSKATNQLSNTFSPTYAADNISNDWLAPAASSVLSAQFDPLSSQLSNANKRGTLNSVGYEAALKQLGNKRTSATSTVNNLGTNILNNDRTGVDNYITGAKNDAAGLNAATVGGFDPSKYLSGANDLISGYRNNFAGDLSNAVGDTAFSSLGELLNAGGVVQGANDPSATNPTAGGGGQGGPVSDAFIAQQALANEKRGLGSTGAF